MSVKSAVKVKSDKPKVMDELLTTGTASPIPKTGEIVNARVIAVAKGEVILDIDGFTTGVVRGKELMDESGEFSHLKVGDDVQATVLDIENERGMMELSFRSAGHRKAWGRLEELRKSGEVVEVKVMDANKGGLIVMLGRVGGFLPVSQLTYEHYPRVEGGNKQKILERLRAYVGQGFKVRVIDVKPQEEKLIVSEKAAALTERIASLEGLKAGAVVEGKVTSVVDFGAFVEFVVPPIAGNGDSPETIEGLIHISEIAWHRVDHPKDVLSPGMPVRAMIIGVEGGRVSLSLKRLEEDPWKTVAERFKPGDTVRGKVVKVNHYGAFVEVDKSIHGLAHVSELAATPMANPLDAVKIGEEYEFRITNVDPGAHRLGLSLRPALVPEPAAKEEGKPATPAPAESTPPAA